MKRSVLILTVLLVVTSSAFAQPNPCVPEGCRTQTQGGWGANCNGNNPGCLRDQYFASAFPSGLEIGIPGANGYSIFFSNSNAVRVFLPVGETPSSLPQDYTDPTTIPNGVFAGQVTALAISVGFSNYGVTGFCDLASLYYQSAFHHPSYPFSGLTVQQILDLANDVLGGDLSGLPFGTTISDLNSIVDFINNNFDNGNSDDGYLVGSDCDIQLAVELLSFSGVAREDGVALTWRTAAESSVASYDIESANGVLWELRGRVNGLGDNPNGHTYNFVDRSVEVGRTYVYRLVEVEMDGSRNALGNSITVTAGINSVTPTEFALNQNYPNPFNPTTRIEFTLGEASDVSLRVFDVTGREVSSLIKGSMSAGSHSVEFDAANLSAGVYFYELKAGTFASVRKMMLLK
ncbi:T9SS type A sorting domain-containing protein [bacterium]|nr:T9SS type A sorting domain-containing protein [bacterium]